MLSLACSTNSSANSDLSSLVSMDRDASIGAANENVSESKVIIPGSHALEHPYLTKLLTEDNGVLETRKNLLNGQVESESKEEPDVNNDTTSIEADTSATLTANANVLESFKMQQPSHICVEYAQNSEVVESFEVQRTKVFANPLSNNHIINLASCDEEDSDVPADKYKQQHKKEDSYEVATPSEEVEYQLSIGAQMLGNPSLPTLNPTDYLCIGIGEDVKLLYD